MNRRIKTVILGILLILGVSLSVPAQSLPDLKEVQLCVDDFAEGLAKTLPFNSAMGLNWADAYIGKFMPSLPPHFGVGGSFGITTMDLPVMETLMGFFGYSFPFSISKTILPVYTAEARIGGFFLPFDVGVKFGYLPPLGLWGTSLNMKYLLLGADIRYAILDKPVLPKISIGVGFNYLSGGVGGKGETRTIAFGSDSITLDKPDVNLEWDTYSIDFKAQISKAFLIITPYLGIAGNYAWSSAGYSVDAGVSWTGDIKEYLKQNGLADMDLSSTGVSSTIKNSAFNARAFGGFSVNLMVFKLDFTGLYSFRDSNYGASLGARFQM